jgi:hypothetical protein
MLASLSIQSRSHVRLFISFSFEVVGDKRVHSYLSHDFITEFQLPLRKEERGDGNVPPPENAKTCYDAQD